MDHHPWRFPAVGDELCPVCTALHAPFHPPPPPPPPEYHVPFHPPPPMWAPPGPGPHPYELIDMEGPHKRMRLAESPPPLPPFDPYGDGMPPPLPPPPPGMVHVEGDRLLGLIRDHGPPPPLPPPGMLHGDPFPPPDRFGYGGGRGYPLNDNPYGPGGGFSNFEHAGRLPPWHERHVLGSGFVPGGGSQERHFNHDHHYHRFQHEESPGTPPIPPPSRYAEGRSRYDSHGWHPEADVPPPPPEPPVPSPPDYHAMPPLQNAKSSLFPIHSGSPSATALPPSSHTLHQAHSTPNANRYNGPIHNEVLGLTYQPHLEQHMRDGRQTQAQNPINNAKISVISACDLFKQPLRGSRPDHIVIILRGLPGSGKSYLAKALRDLEVENGGNAPRIHSMDDYFMIEVEKKVEENEGSKSSSTSKGRKQLTKKVIEYCYEPEMEETYRSSMLNAFKKTLDEGNFTFVIVDDRNLRVADFAQFWACAKKSGYEVYLLEAPYKDPTGCAARNVHGFTVDDVKKMAADWEEAPPLYLRVDTHSLFHDDNRCEHSIQEVDMDTEDVDDTSITETSTEGENTQKAVSESLDNGHDQDVSKAGDKWDSEEEDPDGYKELGQSKWSKDFDEDTGKSEHKERSTHALSGLAQTYGTRRKTVTWGDRLEKGGFSIGAAKRRLTSSLIIGPGSGYNLVSNPLAQDNSMQTKGAINNDSKKRFSEQLRDEGESFRAVFDKRRQRIGVFGNGDGE
uniref:YLP motif-containing protein 1 n=1 Tax=Leersia perrieri TaxID=77586 RepID=A0A0D9VDP6_9ORYZ